jgi:membrane fusion protein
LNVSVSLEKMRRGVQSAPVPAPLFRQEALAERQTQWLGTVLLEPRISHKVSASVAVVAAAAVIATLVFGSYTRKERVSGWLMPEKGVVRVLPPQSGVVKSIKVKEGASVAKGDPLLVLSAEVESEAIGATGKMVVQQLSSRRDNLALQKDTEVRLSRQQADELQARLTALKSEDKLLDGEIDLQRRRVQLSADALSRASYLLKRGIITKASLGVIEAEHLDQTSKLQALERSLSQLRRETAAAETAFRAIPDQLNIKTAGIGSDASAVEQQIAEAEARREFVITAPQDGVVTAIQTEAGGSAAPGVPLMSIVPKDTVLQAQLFSPSRAIGFIHKSQDVLLRYQPFPYQHFGFYQGNVSSVSLSSVSPGELPPQLAGLSAFYGKTNEPLYRITVDLERQDVTAYGRRVPLQPGMQLEADILVERHRLIEWILYPIFARTSAWTG